VRARLDALSEVPGAWKQAVSRWARINRRGRTMIDGQSFPSRNEEYLLYQTLVGSWPLEPMDAAATRAYTVRIVSYMQKAVREAKVHTSWLNPNERHEHAMTRFVEMALSPENTAFREDFLEFSGRIARFGIYTSLAQVAIKIGAPGVPDFYQGTELWDFSVVDPDNRRPVDYARRRGLLSGLEAALSEPDRTGFIEELMAHPEHDAVKLFATTALLRFRRERRELFEQGSYTPVAVEGTRRDHVFAFARAHQGAHALIIVPRLVATIVPDGAPPLGEPAWGDTRLKPDVRSAAGYRDVFTGRCVSHVEADDRPALRMADVFERFPIACLEAQ
jgi:(1->4)-alpha-D-glucan 1-alpha-D-glucosylmutase